jgi:signal transduction histidine kinase
MNEDYSRLTREELEAECRALEARAERAEALTETFLVAVTHELNTPLNAILGFSQALLQGLSGPLNETQGRQLGSIEKSAKRLMVLVNDVLDLSKAQSGKLKFAMEEFDAGLAARKVAAEFQEEAARRGLAVELAAGLTDGKNGDLHAIGDLRRFEQILRNIIANAVKFTEKGWVRVYAETVDGWLKVAVADTGIGISAEGLSEIFKPFRQLDSGRARHYEGAGLGLSLSKFLIEAMGGSIEVESSPGQGSTFTIRLQAPSTSAI